MKSDEKISVIVPIYKVEPYLRTCIDSIRNQTYTNLEIILVDDGSPDHCPEICDEYAAVDERIRVIHKENGGLSDARNAGLETASGEWISFIDSDDRIEPDMYETLLTLAGQYEADISVGGVSDELIKDGKTEIVKTTETDPVSILALSPTDAMKRYFTGSWSAWDKIYRREIFSDIRYPVGEINEDEAIVLRVLEQSHRVVYTTQVFYHYIRRPESITTASFSPKKLAWSRHCKANLVWLQSHHPELTELAAARYRSSILWSLTEMALSDDNYSGEVRNLLTELRQNKAMFLQAPFQHKSDYYRTRILLHLPFCFYKYMIRIKRSVI